MGKPVRMWVLSLVLVTIIPGIEFSVVASSDYGLGLLNQIMVNDPSKLCYYVTCQEPNSPNSCPVKTVYLDGTSQFGCCGSCVAFKQLEESCTGNINPIYGEGYSNYSTPDTNFLDSLSNTSENNIVQSSWCDYNFECDDNKKCKTGSNSSACMTMLEKFIHDTADSSIYKPYRDDYRWKPICTPEGLFAAKQCKGPIDSQRCVCVDPDGNRLFGAALPVQEELFNTMNCKCSRQVWEKQQAGESSVTLHCFENGNFESLQCEDEWCYCVEPHTGNIYGPTLPDSAIHMLPCYNKTTTGEQYLRRCESERHAHNKLVDAMTNHGIKGPESLTTCDQDGSFASKQCDQESCLCWDKYKYQSIAHPAGNGCQCARDREYYKQTDSLITVKCKVSEGTYEEIQLQGSYKYCVDEDGIRSSPMVLNSDEYILQCKYAKLCQESGSDNCLQACVMSKGEECPEEAYAYNQKTT